MPSKAIDRGEVQAAGAQLNSVLLSIETLATSDVSPDEFFPRFIECVTQGSSAQAGAVWYADDSGELSVKSEHGYQNCLDQETGWHSRRPGV